MFDFQLPCVIYVYTPPFLLGGPRGCNDYEGVIFLLCSGQGITLAEAAGARDAAVPVVGLHGDGDARTHVPIPVLPLLTTGRKNAGPIPIPGRLLLLKRRKSPVPVLLPRKGRGNPVLIPGHLTQIRISPSSLRPLDLLMWVGVAVARQCSLIPVPDPHLRELRDNNKHPVIINQRPHN